MNGYAHLAIPCDELKLLIEVMAVARKDVAYLDISDTTREQIVGRLTRALSVSPSQEAGTP